MSTTLWIDGVDAAAAYGLTLTSSEGARDLPATRLDTIAVPDVAGVSLLAEPVIEARPLSFTAILRGSSPADVRTKRDTLAAVLRRRTVTIRLADAPTRELPVHVLTAKVPTTAVQMLARSLPLSLELLALDPYWRDTTTQSLTVGTTPVPTPLGTAPSFPMLSIASPGAVMVITLRNALGAVVTQLQLAGLEPGVACTIDCAAKTIRQGAVSMLSTIVSGDFPVLDAVADGDFAASAWPTLALSQASATVTYARRWA